MSPQDFQSIIQRDCVHLTSDELRQMSPDQRKACAKHIATLDLSKSIEELITNVHEELLCDRTPSENELHANKRIAAVNAISTIQARKSANTALIVAIIALVLSIIGIAVDIAF